MSESKKPLSWSLVFEAVLGFIILFGFPYYTFKNNSWDIIKTHSWIFVFLSVWAVGWVFYLRWLYITLKTIQHKNK